MMSYTPSLRQKTGIQAHRDYAGICRIIGSVRSVLFVSDTQGAGSGTGEPAARKSALSPSVDVA